MPDRAVQIDARFLPAPLHRSFRYAAHGGDLGERETAEELQIDDLGQRRIDRREGVESVANPAQFLLVDPRVAGLLLQGSNLEAAAALLGLAVAGVVDDETRITFAA